MEAEEEIEVLPRLVHKIAPTTKGLSRLKRRFHQIKNAVIGPDYKDPFSLFSATLERYGSPGEVDFYRIYASYGFHPHEDAPVALALNKLQTMPRALVVGCGSGREVFALEALGCEAVGIDVCKEMIECAQAIRGVKNSKCSFHHLPVERLAILGKFDLVLPTFGINNHIQGRTRRVELFQNLKSALNENGVLILFRDDQAFSWRSRFAWMSLLLKWRWRKTKMWEKGDTLRSFLGAHNNTEKMIYWHYYPTPDHLSREMKEAGLFELGDRLVEVRAADYYPSRIS